MKTQERDSDARSCHNSFVWSKKTVHCYRLVGLPNVKHHQCLTSCTLSLLKIIINGYVYILHIQYLTNEKDINVPQYMQQLVKFKVRNLIVIGLINA